MALPCLALLLAHTWSFRFLTDDAFISFRYARNLTEGHGLVFNPGGERVEGYTNFLWVIVLAGIHALGVPADVSAIPLGLLLTIGLFLLLLAEIRRDPPEPGREWLAAVPLLMLACTRSVAVWGTSGLETRFFEVLTLAGILRWVREVRRAEAGERARPVAMPLLGLAALTRPDGVLVGLMAFAAGAVWLARGRELARVRPLLAGFAAFVALVAAHLTFRWLYYHDIVPNTYYAKVGGLSWWSMGFLYLGMCALEYGLLLFIPLLVAGAREYVRRGDAFVPFLFAAIVVPHCLFVASVGGDHFEYRPLDLYFPFAFLLAYQGARSMARRSNLAAAAAVGVCFLALVSIPERSRRFTPHEYIPGYPFTVKSGDPRSNYLNPHGWAPFEWPGLRHVDEWHQRGLRKIAARFIGLRQEEHRAFLDTMKDQARRLAPSLASGAIPSDTYLSTDCVGYVPYATRLRTLDRRGLTDREVAQHGRRDPWRLMAHERYAEAAYARERGVEIWPLHPSFIVWRWRDPAFLAHVKDVRSAISGGHFLDLGDGLVIYAWLPQGVDEARRRFPRLTILEASEIPEFLHRNPVPPAAGVTSRSGEGG